MNMLGTPQWNPQEQVMQQASEDDFQQFLNMNSLGAMPDGLGFDFGMLPPSAEPIDTAMTGTEHQSVMPASTATGMTQSQMAAITTGPSHIPVPAQIMAPPPNDVINEIDARIQYLQQQRLQQQQRQILEHSQSHQQQQQQQHQPMSSYFSPNHVPPTPQSLELAAASGTPYFMSADAQQSVFESRFHQLKDQQQDMDFTPLVSPAVTPLDPQFSVDIAFSVTGNYFSPLTSPALHAQNDNSILSELRHNSTSSNSPVDPNEEWPNQAEPPVKKVRKAPTKAPRAKASVRQSPIVKPQRRRTIIATTAATSIASKVLNEVEEDMSKASSRRKDDSEENVSVSPEALSDMPPPPPPLPRRKSATASPFIQPQNGKASASRPVVPATPASLMRLPASKATSTPPVMPNIDVSNASVDSFKLPEPAAMPESLKSPAVNTPMQATGTAEASTKMTAPLPSPVFAKPRNTSSAAPSPQILPAGSSTPNPRKTPQLSARGSKRSGSVHASPALLPKISPNIKPLLPNGAEDAASRLLATKSNYQNILEGNTVPGVTYPSELSTNLTSKRTSHKIAEQGRRNRINSALQEIATLLPKAPPKESVSDDAADAGNEKKAQANAPNSKASTVEMAIEYIKQLKEEVAAANRRAEEAEKKLREKSATAPVAESS
ncbi:hypothetical protein TD95_004231 [Thielaviopsis punctulata]|uniref:BHLH domain-containing protein n=1 Tax=Thielaviopsis punctulata TaxID=72032 RepID=A0A0F4Z809_9PEZI|nr:hypothetical protein TD95_004231 [Thielaviopsis punctulata]